MTKGSIKPMLAFAAALLLASCAKEGPKGPVGPAGPSLSGSISGHVKLYDKYGSEVLTGLYNTLLYLNGSATPVSADSTGYYSFANLVTGVYSVSASCTGYGATMLNNIQFVAGSLNRDIRMSAIPDSFIQTFHAYHNTGSVYDSLVFTAAPDSRARNFIVFLGRYAGVTNAVSGYLLAYPATIAPNIPLINLQIPGSDLLNGGFASGDKIYFAAYSYVTNDASVYEDFTTGKYVYNAVNALPVIDSAIVP